MHTSEPGLGSARYVFELVQGLVEINTPVALFCPSNFEYLQKLEASGAEVFAVSARKVELCGFAARITRNVRFLLTTSWYQLRVTRRGDIVHFQFPVYFPFGLIFFVLATLKKCLIVFTAHDPVPHKWLWPGHLRGIERNTLRFAYRLSRRLIVHNDIARRTLIQEFGLDPRKISIISHGPFSATGCSSNLPAMDEFWLLAFGSIRETKGIHLAIQAVQRLNSDSSMRVNLTIAGRVANAREEDYWRRCKSLIQEQPQGIRVLERHIPEDDVGQLLRGHHAVVLPYLDFSSESGVASLALSNRRAILATRVGGLEALLAACDCGIAIETASVDGVADAISKAVRGGRQMLEGMGAEGERFLLSTRSWKEISLRTLTLYTELTATESR
jgi:glycogen synthase